MTESMSPKSSAVLSLSHKLAFTALRNRDTCVQPQVVKPGQLSLAKLSVAAECEHEFLCEDN